MSAAGPALAAADPEIVVGPHLVVEADSGRVLSDFDAVRPWFPASTTKLMTIYSTFRAIRFGEIALDTEIVYSRRAALEPPSKMGFRPGTMLTLDHALKMMMVKSANDVSVAVAEAVGGTVEGFAERMNDDARRLGMTGSHFVNPHGLPDKRQVTTARDMALLAQALLTGFPEHRDFYRIHAIQIGGKTLKNYNRLITRYPGTNGMKTGFICASGYNLVASAKRGDRELIAVVFGEYSGKSRGERAAALLEDGFAVPPLTEEPAATPTQPAGDEPTDAQIETTPVRAEVRADGPPADADQPEEDMLATLANITSGSEYDAPFDMRPLVCGPARNKILRAKKKKAEEAGTVSYLGEPTYLGPPVKVAANVPAVYGEPGYVARVPRARPLQPGEPLAPLMIAKAEEEPAADDAVNEPAVAAADAPAEPPPPLPKFATIEANPKTGTPKFVINLPRPRPVLPGEEPRAEVLDAFAPVDGSAKSPSAEAIGAAAGAPQSLDDVKPQ